MGRTHRTDHPYQDVGTVGGTAGYRNATADAADDPAPTTPPTPVTNDGGVVVLADLPTADPGDPGQLWNDAGTLKISV